MKEYTFMFMNVHKKHTIYGKGDEDQRETLRTLPKMVKTMNNGRMFLKSIISRHLIKKLLSVNSGQKADLFL